jgi:hypothetical protein
MKKTSADIAAPGVWNSSREKGKTSWLRHRELRHHLQPAQKPIPESLQYP